MSTCDCFSGTPADGHFKPKGSFKAIGDVNAYQSIPSQTAKEGEAQHILLLPDGFGLAAHNLRLADMYAAKGYFVTIVDYFDGDALPDCFMKYTPGTDLDAYDNLSVEEKDVIRKINMPEWQGRHQPSRIASVLDGFLPAYLEAALGKRHIVGHCFGGKSSFRLAKCPESFTSAVIFHPAFLERSDLKNIKMPVFLGCAESDVFTPTLSADMLAALPHAGCAYKLVVYGNTVHGFASRADPKCEGDAKSFQNAFDDGIAWMALHR